MSGITSSCFVLIPLSLLSSFSVRLFYLMDVLWILNCSLTFDFFFFFASGGWRTSTLFSTSFFRILCRLVLFYPESFIVSVKMFNFNICWTSIGSINNSKAFASPMAVYFKRNQEERNIKSNAYWVANFPQIRTRTSHWCCRLVNKIKKIWICNISNITNIKLLLWSLSLTPTLRQPLIICNLNKLWNKMCHSPLFFGLTKSLAQRSHFSYSTLH